MKTVRLLLCLLALIAAAAQARVPEGWAFVEYNEAVRIARQTNKPMFVYFGFNTCPYCIYLNEHTLSFGALVEFKTDLLEEKVTSFEEQGHRSWQIGPFTGHHCHFDLGAVREVLFDAEPVSCQGGRLNYTVWFSGGEDCGNPYRPNALFSVTLNGPYEADGTRKRDIVGQVYQAYDELRSSPLVHGSEAFLQARDGL